MSQVQHRYRYQCRYEYHACTMPTCSRHQPTERTVSHGGTRVATSLNVTFSSRVQIVFGGSLTRLRVKSPIVLLVPAEVDSQGAYLAHRKPCSDTWRAALLCVRMIQRHGRSNLQAHARNDTECVVLHHGTTTNPAKQPLLHAALEPEYGHLVRGLYVAFLQYNRKARRIGIRTSSMSMGTLRVQIHGRTMNSVMPITYQKSCCRIR